MTKERVPGFWQRRVVAPLLAQLTQGVTPGRLAFTCAIGIALGIFPILGSTTVLCFIAGFVLKLNQPAIQVVNYLVYPVQILLFPVFVRLGVTLFRAGPLTFSLAQVTREFHQSPIFFFSKYGIAGLHGIAVWALAAPALIAGLYYPFVLTFRKMAPWGNAPAVGR